MMAANNVCYGLCFASTVCLCIRFQREITSCLNKLLLRKTGIVYNGYGFLRLDLILV